MTILFWLGQAFLAVLFLFSGLMKATQTERKLVTMGMTGVEKLPLPLIRLIGVSEVAGVVGLLLPTWTNQWPVLTPLAALCLGLIMMPAAVIHYRRGETKSVWLNGIVLLVCLFVAYHSVNNKRNTGPEYTEIST